MPERKTVLIALAANAAIAVVKGIAGVVSGSAAMLAEAAHSVADTASDAREAGKSWREHIRESTEPTSTTVVAEDTVAVVGVLVAAAGVGLHQATGGIAWDAGAAIVVGLMLVYVAYLLGRNYKDLLIGAGARPDERRRIRELLSSHPGVDEVLDLRTMYVGPESLLVAARLDLADNGLDAEAIERLANEIDEQLRQAVPQVSEVFLDPTPR